MVVCKERPNKDKRT